MIRQPAPSRRAGLRAVGLVFGALVGFYMLSYLVVSRRWRSDLAFALGSGVSEGVTSYVPIRHLATDRGYRLHCLLSALYEPLWRLDRLFGGPSPINICQGIRAEKQ